MKNRKHTGLIVQHIWRRRFQSLSAKKDPTNTNLGAIPEMPGSNWNALLEQNLKTKLPREIGSISIYKVPPNMRQVEPKAYDPNIISIGPYHHEVPHLQDMEELKQLYFRRLLKRSKKSGTKLDHLKEAMKELEQEARNSYSENLELSSDKFVDIMLRDGCFIIELLREMTKHEFKHGSAFIKRWMLPILRRDLIMLENQLPLSVLCKLFDLTSNTLTTPTPSLQELALRFFDPLMPRNTKVLNKGILATQVSKTEHFLDLFRLSIIPSTVTRGEEPHMFSSMMELKEAGIKTRMSLNCQQLELSFEKLVLKIPPLYIDDYRGTLFRNMMAFEQCHPTCNPDVTAYLYFLNGLINSAEDVGLLHYEGIIQHSLGCNAQVAALVNGLCKEVARDYKESYLYDLIGEIDCHCKDRLTIVRLVQDYANMPWANIFTLVAGTTTFFGTALLYVKELVKHGGEVNAYELFGAFCFASI